MDNCKVSIWLAYGMAAYCLASSYYFFKTRNIGTPFKDSLTQEQYKIKEEAVKLRGGIFYEGIGIALIMLVLIRPFKNCS